MDESTRVLQTPNKTQIVLFFFFWFHLVEIYGGDYEIRFVFLIFENVWPLLAFSDARLI